MFKKITGIKKEGKINKKKEYLSKATKLWKLDQFVIAMESTMDHTII